MKEKKKIRVHSGEGKVVVLIDFILCESLWFLGKLKNGIIELLQFSMCCLQILEEEMPFRVHLCTLLPTRRASEVRERAQDIRSEQCDEASERASSTPEGRCSELACL